MQLLNYIELMRLNKPIGFFLLLWPTLIAIFLAGKGKPDSSTIILFTIGVLVMRSAGCVINDIADRKFDVLVERTKTRPLASNLISVKSAYILLVVLLIIALCIVLQFNLLTIQLSLIALLLTIIYPLMKRYIHIPQAILGVAFGVSIPMAFTAMTGAIPNIAYALYLTTIFWVIAYDTQYALADKKDDLVAKIKSSAIFFGQYDKLMICLLQSLSIVGFVYIGWYFELRKPYYMGILLAIFLMIYQYHLIKDRNPKQCFKAFLNNYYVGLFLFSGLLCAINDQLISNSILYFVSNMMQKN